MRPVINFTLKQVQLVIDVKMFDSMNTIEPMAYDHCNKKN